MTRGGRLGSKVKPWRCNKGHEMPKKTCRKRTESDEQQCQPQIEG
jgi:hypothetical protein